MNDLSLTVGSSPLPRGIENPGCVDTEAVARTVPSRVRVKICGITSAADAELAISAGADALGFNAWQGSKRYLNLHAASEWMRHLPGFVTRVALCVNAPLEEALRLEALPGVDILQFHGDESPEYCAAYAAGVRSFIRAVRLASEADVASLASWGTRQVLVDAAVPGAFGGTGTLLDAHLAMRAVASHSHLSVTLAGGLDPENVAEAVRIIRPYAVDVASGVESAPGKKDASKMRAFVEAVRSAKMRC